jgi:hypothetical protein
MLASADGTVLINFFKRRGIFCFVAEETGPAGLTVLSDPVVGEDLWDLLLKAHARYDIAIEEVEPADIFCEEVS